MSWKICGPSNMPAFIFFILNPWNFVHIKPKHVPILFKALINCFTNPSLIWSGGNMMLFLSTKGYVIMYSSPTIMLSLRGHCFLFKCSSLAIESHKHINHGFFVPSYCPRRKIIILRSTQITHWWLRYDCVHFSLIFTRSNWVTNWDWLVFDSCETNKCETHPNLFL